MKAALPSFYTSENPLSVDRINYLLQNSLSNSQITIYFTMPRLFSLVIYISMAISFSSAVLLTPSNQFPIAQAPLPLANSQKNYPSLLKYIDSSDPSYI